LISAYGSFVASFPFEETPDQIKTMGEVLADMQSHKPMFNVRGIGVAVMVKISLRPRIFFSDSFSSLTRTFFPTCNMHKTFVW
jgi:hypothetical protein